jgi:hypothetical protein
LNVAVTDLAAFIVTMQLAVPEQPAPDQPAKDEPAAAAAVKVTLIPLAYACEQVEPQLIPAGELDTVPDPLPPFDTDRVNADADPTNPSPVASTATH